MLGPHIAGQRMECRIGPVFSFEHMLTGSVLRLAKCVFDVHGLLQIRLRATLLAPLFYDDSLLTGTASAGQCSVIRNMVRLKLMLQTRQVVWLSDYRLSLWCADSAAISSALKIPAMP